jgi:hypothetical protein
VPSGQVVSLREVREEGDVHGVASAGNLKVAVDEHRLFEDGTLAKIRLNGSSPKLRDELGPLRSRGDCLADNLVKWQH